MSLSLSCHWIFFYFSFLASHWWAATRRGIVGMLRISDSFSRPYQWTLVITLSLLPPDCLFDDDDEDCLTSLFSFSLAGIGIVWKRYTNTKTFCLSSFEIVFFSGPFLLFFLGKFSPSEGVGSVCLLFVAGRRTQVTQIHNTKRRKNLFFFFYFYYFVGLRRSVTVSIDYSKILVFPSPQNEKKKKKGKPLLYYYYCHHHHCYGYTASSACRMRVCVTNERVDMLTHTTLCKSQATPLWLSFSVPGLFLLFFLFQAGGERRTTEVVTTTVCVCVLITPFGLNCSRTKETKPKSVWRRHFFTRSNSKRTLWEEEEAKKEAQERIENIFHIKRFPVRRRRGARAVCCCCLNGPWMEGVGGVSSSSV
jgi:hypothetical protein